MAIFRCKMCSAQLDVKPGQLVCECGYCGSTQTIPNGDDEQKVALYNRANNLRFRSDFDKAIVAYQSIVAKYPKESEAHWGLCLSKYGIEYVDDPKTGEKIPTCHRTLYESILEDSDYLEALENADVIAKDIYIAEAKEIDRIQKRIIRISQKEDPYDIFICYKESDDAGGRTIDSVLAQDIYDKLTDKGYKVFFARITLENKLGQEYEPIIFAALRSAKVMLVVGTKEDYFNAVWVKNEWSRFLSFMANDKNKYLIPCYKDIDAYDMPEEFTPLQSQDLGKIGYLQDLARGIDKIFGRDEKKAAKTVVTAAAAGSFSGYYSRIEQAIKNGQFEKADWLIESVLAGDENDAKAYYYRIFVEEEIEDLDFLGKDVKDPFDYKNFSIAYRNANPEFKAELDEIIERTKKNQLQRDYEIADTYRQAHDYERAIAIYQTLGSYLDSKERITQCEQEKAEYEAALERDRQVEEINKNIVALNKKKTENIEQIKKSKASIAAYTSKKTRTQNFSRLASIFGYLALGSAGLNLVIFLIVGLVTYFNSYEIQDSNYLGFFIALTVMYVIQNGFCGFYIMCIRKHINPSAFFVLNIILTSVAYILCIVFASLFSGYDGAWGIGIGPLFLEWFVLCFSIPFSIFCKKSNETRVVSYFDVQRARNNIAELQEKNRQLDGQIKEFKNQIQELRGEDPLPDVEPSSSGSSTPKTSTYSQSARSSSYSYRQTGPSVGNKVLGILHGVLGAVACGFAFIADIVVFSTGVSNFSPSLTYFTIFLFMLHIAFFVVFIVFSKKRPAPALCFIFSLIHTVLIIIFLSSAVSLSSTPIESYSYSYYYGYSYYSTQYYQYSSVLITFTVFSMLFFIVSTIMGLIRMIKYKKDD